MPTQIRFLSVRDTIFTPLAEHGISINKEYIRNTYGGSGSFHIARGVPKDGKGVPQHICMLFTVS